MAINKPAKSKARGKGPAVKLAPEHSSPLINDTSFDAFAEALHTLKRGFADLPEFAPDTPGGERLAEVLTATAQRLQNSYPYFHPLYAGQMLKPPHPVAQLAYALAMTINPNNHALDGGRATSAMEKEAVAQIAAMFGWKTFLGHLCGGGTMANLEALWVAGQTAPRKTILASAQAHYTHERISKVLQLPFETVECDALGRMSVSALEKRIAEGGVGAVVVTLGTTATGSVDPLHQIVELRKRHEFRIHADAAYGGYFALVDNLDEPARQALAATGEADSIAIDPHKHGLQPYGCGCVLFKDPAAGRWYKHSSPYTYFTSSDLHLGEISLECSRPGAAAAALWATQELLPLVQGGEFARSLAKSREAALALFAHLRDDERFMVPFRPELDLVIFAVNAGSVSETSALSRRVFEAAAKRDLHLALVELPLSLWVNAPANMVRDRDTMTCLRSVLMKPEHLQWVERIWERLGAALVDVQGAKSGIPQARR
jgi:glutamate/tyrosine decarboxylase-like PLP-dependent enzyme